MRGARARRAPWGGARLRVLLWGGPPGDWVARLRAPQDSRGWRRAARGLRAVWPFPSAPRSFTMLSPDGGLPTSARSGCAAAGRFKEMRSGCRPEDPGELTGGSAATPDAYRVVLPALPPGERRWYVVFHVPGRPALRGIVHAPWEWLRVQLRGGNLCGSGARLERAADEADAVRRWGAAADAMGLPEEPPRVIQDRTARGRLSGSRVGSFDGLACGRVDWRLLACPWLVESLVSRRAAAPAATITPSAPPTGRAGRLPTAPRGSACRKGPAPWRGMAAAAAAARQGAARRGQRVHRALRRLRGATPSGLRGALRPGRHAAAAGAAAAVAAGAVAVASGRTTNRRTASRPRWRTRPSRAAADKAQPIQLDVKSDAGSAAGGVPGGRRSSAMRMITKLQARGIAAVTPAEHMVRKALESSGIALPEDLSLDEFVGTVRKTLNRSSGLLLMVSSCEVTTSAAAIMQDCVIEGVAGKNMKMRLTIDVDCKATAGEIEAFGGAPGLQAPVREVIPRPDAEVPRP